jgi:hypothetical protein
MRWIALILIILFTDACVDPLAVPGLNSKRLVVDGLITNQSGPHKVSVYYTLAVNEKQSVSYPGATVVVIDDLGNRHDFTAYDSGVHRSGPDLHGVIGRSYTLEVTLDDGTIYRSTSQRMYAPGVIQNVYAQFEPQSINMHDMFAPHDSYAVYIDARGDDHSLFRWRTTGTYEVQTFPELHVSYLPGNPPTEVPTPLPCANVNSDSNPDDEFPQNECSCCTCWITEHNQGVTISNSRYVNDNAFNRVFVARIPFDGLRFFNKYHILVEQLSLSDDVYEFWKAVKSQEGNTSIFQANVARAKGNIVNEADASDEVLGCFAASAISHQAMVIDRFDAPVPAPLADSVIADCRKHFKRSTNHKPPFW